VPAGERGCNRSGVSSESLDWRGIPGIVFKGAVTSVTSVTFLEAVRSFKITHYVDIVNTTPISQEFVIMRMRYVLILMIALWCFGPAGSAQSQPSPSEGARKVVRKVDPQYPAAAKRMNLGGTVKVVAVVAPDGNVRKVEPVGGSPLFVDAALSAIAQWKYAPGAESRETVELHFTP
jgi:protein TonB